MSLDDWHLVFVSVCIMLVLAACSPVVAAYLPRREEPFFALAVLGEKNMAEHYYPGDDPNLKVGETARWTVYLYNHMGSAQYISIRFKLLNSTMSAPNSTSCLPGSGPIFYEVRRVLTDNETLLQPLGWSIVDVGRVGDSVMIEGLSVNGYYIKTDSIARNGSNFRIILELWVYNTDLRDFRFGWSYDDELRCAWNQIWFNATLTSG
jgi:hypothetical protein